MFVGVIEFDLLLGDVHSRKGKRALVRPLVAGLRRFEVAAAEVGALDLYRRAEIGAAVVAPDARRCIEVMDQCERWVAARPEAELLSCRRRLLGDEDE